MRLALFALLFLVMTGAGAHAETYQGKSAKEKRLILWEQVLSSEYQMLPETKTGFGPSFLLSSLKSLGSLSVSFDRASDVLPAGRRKIIHPFGTVGLVRWEPISSRYTGIFASGGVGLARLSIAGDPSLLGFTPGMALKMLIDGKPSVNLQVMYSLDGQGENTDFFAHDFTNDIPAPTNILLKPLAALFALVQNPPTYLPVNHFAAIDAKGLKENEPLAPYALVFKPTATAKKFSASSQESDFRANLSELPRSILLYEIFAKATASARKIKIGELKLESSFVASDFGDQKLFFQHNRER